MEQTVRIVSVGELKESTFTTKMGEQKLLVKREFIISNGYDADVIIAGSRTQWCPAS